MIDLEFSFDGTMWKYSGKAAWYFVTLPVDMSEDIKAFTRHLKTGWGSVRVHVTLGDAEWSTSIFPATKAGAYLLPLKAAIRKSAKVSEGEVVSLNLRVDV